MDPTDGSERDCERATGDPARGEGLRTSVWTDRMMEALGTREEWYSLIDKVHAKGTLALAWEKVRANGGAGGVDGVTVERFARHAAERLERLREELKTGTYRPQAIKRVEIPKSDGGKRPLGIPTVTDRIVQCAVAEVIGPIFESRFEPSSYGFRPGRGCKDALREVDQWLKAGHVHVVDADLKSYFDSIPHDALRQEVFARVKDGAVLKLIEGFLKQEIASELAHWTPETGTPQGAVLSPLLANIYLHPLDVRMRERGYRMIRYADDFVVLCRTQEEAHAALAEVSQWVEAAQLSLHAEKTRLADLSQKEGHFDFLGYRFYVAEDGRLKRTIKPKKRKALYAKLACLTPRKVGRSLSVLIAEGINPWLRGVYEYFKHADRRVLSNLDAHVRYRLRRILAYRVGWRGSATQHRVHQRWRNNYFAACGLFSLIIARQTILHSHRGPI